MNLCFSQKHSYISSASCFRRRMKTQFVSFYYIVDLKVCRDGLLCYVKKLRILHRLKRSLRNQSLQFTEKFKRLIHEHMTYKPYSIHLNRIHRNDLGRYVMNNDRVIVQIEMDHVVSWQWFLISTWMRTGVFRRFHLPQNFTVILLHDHLHGGFKAQLLRDRHQLRHMFPQFQEAFIAWTLYSILDWGCLEPWNDRQWKSGDLFRIGSYI